MGIKATVHEQPRAIRGPVEPRAMLRGQIGKIVLPGTPWHDLTLQRTIQALHCVEKSISWTKPERLPEGMKVLLFEEGQKLGFVVTA